MRRITPPDVVFSHYVNLLSVFTAKRGLNLHPGDAAHLYEHFDARYPLEGQQQEGHEGQPLALRRLLKTRDDCSKLHITFPVEAQKGRWCRVILWIHVRQLS